MPLSSIVHNFQLWTISQNWCFRWLSKQNWCFPCSTINVGVSQLSNNNTPPLPAKTPTVIVVSMKIMTSSPGTPLGMVDSQQKLDQNQNPQDIYIYIYIQLNVNVVESNVVVKPRRKIPGNIPKFLKNAITYIFLLCMNFFLDAWTTCFEVRYPLVRVTSAKIPHLVDYVIPKDERNFGASMVIISSLWHLFFLQ